jgi:hypothetical protein
MVNGHWPQRKPGAMGVKFQNDGRPRERTLHGPPVCDRLTPNEVKPAALCDSTMWTMWTSKAGYKPALRPLGRKNSLSFLNIRPILNV